MMPSGERHNDYDAFALGYTRDNDSNATNAYYERPASLALLGDVAGQRVLDAGCGAGSHAAEIIRRGASVTGLDKSAGLLAIARQRIGTSVPLHQADLADPQPDPAAESLFPSVYADLCTNPGSCSSGSPHPNPADPGSAVTTRAVPAKLKIMRKLSSFA